MSARGRGRALPTLKASAVIVAFNNEALTQFINDRPDSNFQRGYLACALNYARAFGADPITLAQASLLAKALEEGK